MREDVFFEIHQDLPRESPGRDDFTRRAYEMLPPSKGRRILDVGCGPGTATLLLARLSEGQVVGLDTHQPYLDRLTRRAAEADLEDRVRAVHGSMFEMPFADAEFDLLWAEGSIYFIGFDRGLREWRRLLRPGGQVGVQEVAWLKPDPPDELREFWNEEYPAMRSIQASLDAIAAADYELLGHFPLPPEAWWDEYYRPLRERVGMLREKYAGDAQALETLDVEEVEIEIFEKYSDWYGTAFFVMKRRD